MTTTKPDALPDYNGAPVAATAVKFVGLGTGFDGLEVKPVVMELDDEAYFVIHVTAGESASHKRDKKGRLIRIQRLTAEDMAPIDRDTAQKALREYAEEIQRQRDEVAGQQRLDISPEEEAAAAREAADDTDSPSEIATAAAKRAKQR